MQKIARALNLDLKARLTLEEIVSSRRTPERVRLRSQIILLAARGIPNTQIAEQLKVTRPTVQEWRRRYQEGGMEALLSDARLAEDLLQDRRLTRLRMLLEQPGPDGGWTIRTLAMALDTSPTTVHRLLEVGGLNWRPKVPAEFDVGGRVDRLLGIYMHPPIHAVVLECSEMVEPIRQTPVPELVPGSSGWHLLLHLRSIEGLRTLEGFSTHYPSNFLRFVRRIPPSPRDGWKGVVLTDMGLSPEDLQELSRERPDLSFVNLPSGLSWLNAMRYRILPLLQARLDEGATVGLDVAVRGAETFLGENRPDPLLWMREEMSPEHVRDSIGPIPLLFLRKQAEGMG